MLLYTRRKNSSDSQSAFCTHSAVCSLHFVPSLHFVSGLQSAFCTDRYPWHQHSLFLVIVIRTTHTIYHKIPVCELNRHFRYFRVNTLSFCKNIDVTYNVSSNPPTSEKKNKFLHAYHAYLLKYVDVTCSIQVVHRIQGWMEEKNAKLLQEGYRMPKPQHVDAKLYDNVFLLFPDGFYRTLVFVRLFV